MVILIGICILLLLCIKDLEPKLKRQSDTYSTYFFGPPSTIDYPFGDEYFNRDMQADHTQEEFNPIDRNETEIFIQCPYYSNIVDISGETIASFIDLCERCDVNQNNDVYVLNCIKCRPVTTTSQTIQEEVTVGSDYLEIANYTSNIHRSV